MADSRFITHVAKIAITLSAPWVFANAQPVAVSSSKACHPFTGERIEFTKYYDAKTKKTMIHSSSGPVNSMAEFDGLLYENKQREFRNYGAAGPSLRAYIDRTFGFPDTGIVVETFLKLPPYAHLDKTKYDEQTLKTRAIEIQNLSPVASLSSLQGKYGISDALIYSKGRNFFTMRLSRELLDRIRWDRAIAAIGEYRAPRPCGLLDYGKLDFRVIGYSAFNPSPLPTGSLGEGVNVATAEGGLWECVLHCLAVNTPRIFLNDYSDDHSNHCFACLVYSSPGANHFHTNCGNSPSSRNSSYRFNNTIKAMSASFEGSLDARNNPDWYTPRTMDDAIYLWPYTLYCNPADNLGMDSTTGWSCYNHLNVGACRHANFSRYEAALYTSTRNPKPRYGGPWIQGDSSRSDRELPHILCPGSAPTDSGWYDYCLGYRASSGTSYSAPVAVGLVADVISAGNSAGNQYFNNWPELTKATLMLTAQNCDGKAYQGSDYDGRDGAGVASAFEATRFAGTAAIASSVPQVRGFNVGSWGASDTVPSLLPVQMPGGYPGDGKKFRAVLTWNSVTNPDLDAVPNTISDLDLVCNCYNTSYYSMTFNNNTEIIEIPWSSGMSGTVCSLMVIPSHLRFPDSANRDFFYYAIAWDWVKASADTVPEPVSPPIFDPYPDVRTPGAAELVEPVDLASGIPVTVSFKWLRAGLADKYIFELRDTAAPVYTKTDTFPTAFSKKYLILTLQYSKRYYWRIGSSNSLDTTWSDYCAFATEPRPAPVPATRPAGLVVAFFLLIGLPFIAVKIKKEGR